MSRVRQIERIGREVDRRRILGEYIRDDDDVAAVIDGDAGAIVHEPIAYDSRVESVGGRQPVHAALGVVADESVAAEGRFYAVGDGEAEIVHVENVVERRPVR